MLRYMLDTNICIYVSKNHPTTVRDRFNLEAEHLCISAITLAELNYGAEKSARREHNLSVIENLSARLEVLPFGDKAAMHYGDIRADLEKKGTPVGPYDMMIAAHARCEGLVLVSNNLREFERIAGLRLENWV